MADHNSSSISSSEVPVAPAQVPGLTRRRVMLACALAMAGLLASDVLINRLVAMPESPLTRPTPLQQYFDYGRSVEAKLRRMVGATAADTAVVAYAGWLDEPAAMEQTAVRGALRVAVYGQSFAFQIAEALQRQDGRFRIVAKLGGPSAPLSHSHAAYRKSDAGGGVDIVLFGILASSLPRLVSMTNTTTWFESPTPFTYPRYTLEKGELVTTEPHIGSLDGLRRALHEPAAWREFVAQLRRHDAAYDSRLFESDFIDASSFGRLLRRGYGQRHIRLIEQRYHDANGFTNRDGLLDVARALTADIARIAAERGQIPCLLLIHDRGYEDHLVSALWESLRTRGILYLDSNAIARSSDQRNFLVDGHFTESVNEKLAAALRAQLSAPGVAAKTGNR